MLLYSEDASPWCAPVRAAIYAKGLDVRIASPPEGMKSDAYRRISVTGTIPCLVLDDGAPLPESAVILAYLDEKFPERPLAPADPEGRARVALLQRLAEGGVLVPLVEFFHDMTTGDPNAAATAREGLGVGLDRLEHFVAAEGYAAGPAFTRADCVLGPALFGVARWAACWAMPGCWRAARSWRPTRAASRSIRRWPRCSANCRRRSRRAAWRRAKGALIDTSGAAEPPLG